MSTPHAISDDTTDSALARARTGIDELTTEARDLGRRGVSAVRDGTRQLRDQTTHLADSTVGYVRDEPMKAMLIAAAAGALLVGLAALMGRGHRD